MTGIEIEYLFSVWVEQGDLKYQQKELSTVPLLVVGVVVIGRLGTLLIDTILGGESVVLTDFDRRRLCDSA